MTDGFPTPWTATTRLVRPGVFAGQLVRRRDEHRYERLDCPHQHARHDLAQTCADGRLAQITAHG